MLNTVCPQNAERRYPALIQQTLQRQQAAARSRCAQLQVVRVRMPRRTMQRRRVTPSCPSLQTNAHARRRVAKGCQDTINGIYESCVSVAHHENKVGVLS